jgi:hypothetical protein
MGTRNNQAKQDQQQANQLMQESITQSREAFNATKAFADTLNAGKGENTQAASTLRTMGLNFLRGHLAGEDKTKFIKGQLGFINQMAANQREAQRMGRGVGGRALVGPGDANLQNQLDFLENRQSQEQTAAAGEEIYDASLTDAMNQALQGEGAMNDYDTRTLGALSGVAGLANENRNFSFQNKQWANRPGQGIFSKFISPFAQMAMQGAIAFCIDENTRVVLEDGVEAKAGFLHEKDLLLSVTNEGKLTASRITGVRSRLEDALIEVKTENGCRVLATPSHYFKVFIGDRVGITAKEIVELDAHAPPILTCRNGKLERSRVSSARLVRGSGKIIIFTLDGEDNFIAGGIVSFDDKE